MRKNFVFTLLCSLLAFSSAMACTNFIITKGASRDGSCFLTYAADSHQLYGELYYRPAANYPAGSMMDVIEWDTGKKLGQIPQVAHTYSVVGNMNEFQLAIGETTYGGIEELEHGQGLIDYGSLIYITLQRAKNAREAIKVISELLDAYGYASEGESFSIVDPNEAWILDLIGKGEKILDAKGKVVKGWSNGAVWVARRIPDGYVSGHANQSRITTFPLRDGKTSITNRELDKIFLPTVETVYSYDVISFARLKGLYPKDPKQAPDAQFSFCDTYNPITFDGARFCDARVWAFFNHVNHAEAAPYEDYARGDNLKHRMPLWIKPANKAQIDAQFMMRMMRDHYEGTTMDMSKDLGAGPYACPYRWRPMTWTVDGKNYIHERATATQQTGFVFVAQCRNWLPDMFGGIYWFGVDDAGSNCFVPMFCGITEIPEEYKEGNGSMVEYSPTSAFWTFTKVSNYVYTRYSDMIKHVNEKQAKWEGKFAKDIEQMSAKMKDLCTQNPDAARKQLNAYSARAAHDVCQEWNRLFEYLLVKYHDGNVKKEENGKFVTNGNEKPQVVFPDQPKWPDDWYRMIVKDCGKNIEAK
ncbi:MAG: C69 family dipeptidase [Bacteroidales bacterium]|nr:C69 family dipeptidase [Bacteroidales bacterium]